MEIRAARLADAEAIKDIAVATDMFGVDEVGFVDEMLVGALDGSLEDNVWLVSVDTSEELSGEPSDRQGAVVLGAAYYAPEPFSDRMWNLYFISVAPGLQDSGVGAELVDRVEADLRARGPQQAQVLIVETSSTEQYARTREFYPKRGFVEEARIRRFYGPDDDKVVFWKQIAGDSV